MYNKNRLIKCYLFLFFSSNFFWVKSLIFFLYSAEKLSSLSYGIFNVKPFIAGNWAAAQKKLLSKKSYKGNRIIVVKKFNLRFSWVSNPILNCLMLNNKTLGIQEITPGMFRSITMLIISINLG